MTVYLSEAAQSNPLEWFATPSASHTWHEDSVDHLNDGVLTGRSRWTAYNGTNYNDLEQWVEYAFDTPAKITGSDVLWYQDTGGIRVPRGMKIAYWDDSNVKHYVVPTGSGFTGDTYTVFTGNNEQQTTFNQYRFQEITTKRIRLEIQPGPDAVNPFAPGIKQWRLVGQWL